MKPGLTLATGDQSGNGNSAASVSVRASSGAEAGPSSGAAASAGGTQDAATGLDEALQKRLEALIVAHPVMLFMKGAWLNLLWQPSTASRDGWCCSPHAACVSFAQV